MAEITLLTPEQLVERQQKPKGQGRSGRRRSPERTRIIEEYKAALQGVQPGYGADVFLADGEEKRIVRQNLKAAAAEQNLGLEFRPLKDPSRIHLRFITIEEQAAKPKRGGRPRKSVSPDATDTADAAGAAPAPSAASPAEEQVQPAPAKRRRPRKAAAPASEGA